MVFQIRFVLPFCSAAADHYQSIQDQVISNLFQTGGIDITPFVVVNGLDAETCCGVAA